MDCGEKAGTGEEKGGGGEGSVKPKEGGDLRGAVGPEAFPNPKYDDILVVVVVL